MNNKEKLDTAIALLKMAREQMNLEFSNFNQTIDKVYNKVYNKVNYKVDYKVNYKLEGKYEFRH